MAQRSPGRLNEECERSVRGKFGEVVQGHVNHNKEVGQT